MPPIRRITISGFRGILAPLRLDVGLSACVYGRNGTGKSSVTDAWEWFISGRIEHLAREGAEHPAYPHRQAQPGDSFVEVEFSDSALGLIRTEFDRDRMTRPVVRGNFSALQHLIRHPCHIRFADLTRFVYQRKTERYDALAQLMGFGAQVEFQKAMRRSQRQLEETLGNKRAETDAADIELAKSTGGRWTEKDAFASAMTHLLARHGIPSDGTPADLSRALQELRAKVEKDPLAHRLAALGSLSTEVEVRVVDAIEPGALEAYLAEASPFKEREQDLRNLFRIAVYDSGMQALGKQGDKGTCPLCDQRYEGDLSRHISDELEKLKALKEAYTRLNRLRATAVEFLRIPLASSGRVSRAITELTTTDPPVAGAATLLVAEMDALVRVRAEVLGLLEIRPEALDEASLGLLREKTAQYADCLQRCEARRNEAIAIARSVATGISNDAQRKVLVEDYRSLETALVRWGRHARLFREWRGLSKVAGGFKAITEDYVDASLRDVQRRFDEISGDVAAYFTTLESDTPGLSNPVLRILLDQDRSVVPEVVFYGEATQPAYKYLSESQLNSFGLAVFLASVRRFNPDFRFMILDDVVNSLDGYKRPKLIKILKEHFSDTQILLLTHDSVWRDRVYKELPRWTRYEFIRFDFGTGPVLGTPQTTLEEVQDSIGRDRATLAGQALGPYMELQLQEICEAFEVEVKYNKRNEYTLEPLLDRLRTRVRSKLGQAHLLTSALDSLYSEVGFRNLSAHAKNPTIPLTPEEMQAVLNKWMVVEQSVHCPRPECAEVLRYTDRGTFRCGCGQTELAKLPVGQGGG